jgi:hypothetical protein
VPGGINFFSPFSSLDFRLTKDIRLGERIRLSLIGEAFNAFNFTNVRGLSKKSYSGRSIAIGPDFYTAQRRRILWRRRSPRLSICITIRIMTTGR